MDCMPLRPGPFHYLINEQAKSLVALQELQNEVGALLEFRDLVIETFPNLRDKMAAAAASGIVGVASAPGAVIMSPAQGQHPNSRRVAEWEPGKLRRRAPRDLAEGNISLPRSRSNSHSGGGSGGGGKNSATVQDSGFSTEASSKDNSASTAIPRPPSLENAKTQEAEDELWNLLDVIHRKGIRLREEVESLQGRLENASSPDELGSKDDVTEAVKRVSGARDDEGDRTKLELLHRENMQLMDRVAELEAETISSRARAQELQSELTALTALRSGLETKLQSSEIVAPGVQRIQPVSPSNATPPKNSGSITSSQGPSAFAAVPTGKTPKNRFRTRTIEKNVFLPIARSLEYVNVVGDADEKRKRLGALDSVLISPSRVAHVTNVDGDKIAAILRERSPLELKRHLITSTVHNQALRRRVDEVEKSTDTLSERLDKAREENDDLRFQLAERNIELEGTRARVRVLERLQQRPATEMEPEPEPDLEQPRLLDPALEPGSSTESARDHRQQAQNNEVKPSPRRRPSRIPLPGATKASKSAPGKVDSGRESLKSLTSRPQSKESKSLLSSSSSKTRDSSRESLNKSLPKSGTKDQTPRESLSNNKSPTRNGPNRESNKSSLSRARDSLEYANHGNSGGATGPGGTARRPLAPSRRSYSQARPTEPDTGKSYATDVPSSWCSSVLNRSDSSVCPDSLNEQALSANESTRLAFLIGSPTRRFRKNVASWTANYFDSIDLASPNSGEFLSRQGEAMAECDSLEFSDDCS